MFLIDIISSAPKSSSLLAPSTKTQAINKFLSLEEISLNFFFLLKTLTYFLICCIYISFIYYFQSIIYIYVTGGVFEKSNFGHGTVIFFFK